MCTVVSRAVTCVSVDAHRGRTVCAHADPRWVPRARVCHGDFSVFQTQLLTETLSWLSFMESPSFMDCMW